MEIGQKSKDKYQKPYIRKYTNAVNFLCDYYSYRKNINRQFSYELWAAELGFKSKSTLRQLCIGKRNVSLQFVELFSHKENLNEKEIEYFYLLAKMQCTENFSLKKMYLDKIAEQTDLSHTKVDIKNAVKFLSEPLVAKIHLLISFDDFISSEEKLKKMLEIDISKIRRALKTLEDLGLIEPYYSETRKDKLWKSKVKYFSITDQIHKEAINLFHQQTLREAEQMLKLNELSKKFKSLFFSLSPEEFKQLEITLESFSNKLKVQCGNNSIKNKKLYKINFQVYPVTNEFD